MKEAEIRLLVSQLTLEEKAGLCSGLDFWHTKPVERLGIPSVMMTDGPHGLRKQAEGADHLGLNQSVPATCFPSGAGLACSFDPQLLREVGAALGRECNAQGVSILLGPAANIKRSPLCGRNFEYYSEDPVLSSRLAAAYISGVQGEGVGTSMKHYAANNMETDRLTVDTAVDERTLRELYLASFETAVKQSQPWTVMCAYNQVNGDYCSENAHLLTDVLKKEWGLDGFVVSDWGAVNDRVKGIAAGLDLEMPSSGGVNDKKIVEAVKNGSLPQKSLDEAVERILKVVFRAAENQKKKHAPCNYGQNYRLARKTAEECAVLLKNDGGILPLRKEGKIGVFGAFAEHPRYQGGGSSHINPERLDIPLEEIRKVVEGKAEVRYAQGYASDARNGTFSSEVFRSASDTPEEALIAEAVRTASAVDAAVIFAGLPESYESEGYDRKHMDIPEGQKKLIEAVAAVQKNTVVVLSNGAPIEMPWLDRVKGVLECYLGGEAFGGAAADLLFGDANPGGRLAETFPKRLCDNPSWLNFPGHAGKVEYREGLFVGYRYYDKKCLKPLFPFGYGLSYTDFAFTGMTADKTELSDTDTLTVRVTVKNVGRTEGSEVVQLYVSDEESSVIRPVKELKGFAKLNLKPGEEKTAEFVLGKRSFAFYDEKTRGWMVESGMFRILAGKSSEEILLEQEVFVKSTAAVRRRYDRNTTVGELLSDPKTAAAGKKLLEALGAKMGLAPGTGGGALEMFKSAPMRQVVMFSGGSVSEEQIDRMLAEFE